MVETWGTIDSSAEVATTHIGVNVSTYDAWMRSVGIPVHTGFFISDLRTLELEWWEDRGCKAAFIQLMGQEGIIEARVSEIPPGESLPPLKLSVDEVVYVVAGRGLTSGWGASGTLRPLKHFPVKNYAAGWDQA